MFFVLSGFLITDRLLNMRGGAHFFRNFYVRRALRILPIYYMTLLVTLVAARITGRSVGDLPFYLLHLQNFPIGWTQFNPDFPPHMNHTWSLAVEEQFYLLWPLAVWRFSQRRLMLLAIFLIVIAPVVRAVLSVTASNPSLVPTLLPCASDALAWGGLLALVKRLPDCRRLIIQRLFTILGIVIAPMLICLAIRWSAVLWNPKYYLNLFWVAAGLFSLLGVAFAALIAAASDRITGWLRIFQFAPLRHVGKISYGLYLYHWPIFELMNQNLGERMVSYHPAWFILLKIASTYSLSLLSFHFLERPALEWKKRFI